MSVTLPKNLIAKLKRIRMLVLDVDGVMTDGGLFLGGVDQEFKQFNTQDGLGIRLLHQGGVKVSIITGRKSEAVAVRAEELHVDALFQGIHDKADVLATLLERFNLDVSEVCAMGDDLPDLTILRRVGVAAAPANARQEVKAVADVVTTQSGGHGAVREVAELILKALGQWASILELY